jgi:glycosyltransferase involved in cell wall biosynthesis
MGDGDQRNKLQERVEQARLKSVIFTGFVSEEEKKRLLSSSLCLVLPSTAEGWSVALTEAAALGVPSIAYATPAVVEQASMIPSIITVPARDTASLEEAIQATIANPEQARVLGENGRSAALAFNWKASADALLAHFSGMLQ